MVGFIATAEALPSRSSKYCRRFDQAFQLRSRSRCVRPQWSISGGSHLSRTCFYHLRQLRVMRRSLTTDSAHSLIRALVHSLVDYCNGVLAGLPQTQVNRLQSIHRAAARLVLQLPGLGQCLESDACAAPLAFNSTENPVQAVLNGVEALIYLWDLCVPISSLEGRSHLRSAKAGDLRIPSAKTVTIGRHGFSVASFAALEQSIHYSERPYTNFHCFQEATQNWTFSVDVISCNALLRRLFWKAHYKYLINNAIETLPLTVFVIFDFKVSRVWPWPLTFKGHLR